MRAAPLDRSTRAPLTAAPEGAAVGGGIGLGPTFEQCSLARRRVPETLRTHSSEVVDHPG